jgi:imidazole glycerol-phosphate synthase subunit HisF
VTVAVRVIPCLDVDAGRVVKGVNFVDLRDAGDPVELASAYDAAGADELTFLDVTASSDARGTMLDVVRRTAETVFIPLTVGGGVRSVADVDVLLRAGADKVGVNTAAISRPSLISEIADRFGNQVLVLSLDVRARPGSPSSGSSSVSSSRSGSSSVSSSRSGSSPILSSRSGSSSVSSSRSDSSSGSPSWEVTTHGGRRSAGLDAIEWAERVAQLGAGEILLNSMDADGTKAGFDLPLIRAVRAVVDIPVIASGGAGTVAHFPPAVEAGADAVLAASVFHFGDLSIGEVKGALRDAGNPVR